MARIEAYHVALVAMMGILIGVVEIPLLKGAVGTYLIFLQAWQGGVNLCHKFTVATKLHGGVAGISETFADESHVGSRTFHSGP